MFVTFEGVEGAGKSTALKNMARELGQEGVDVLVTREPGGSGLGKALRTLLLDCNSRITPDAELCLFLADRAQHVAEIIPLSRQAKWCSAIATLTPPTPIRALPEVWISGASAFSTMP